MYPIPGYIGIFLILVLAWRWIREKENISKEKTVRRKMIGLQIHRFDKNKKFIRKDMKEFVQLGIVSKVDTDTILHEIEDLARQIVEQDGETAVFEEALAQNLSSVSADADRKTEPAAASFPPGQQTDEDTSKPKPAQDDSSFSL